ncbi:MAG: bifunctional tRNA (5-methylaminomethyl-2-thiouridine)(34)-methyltransferase MnmD/FAD-dependent 5-carboxymethylaminomethyl-2-thiouridine(34) oxidoreductase MnmC [Pedobacter sp.]|nr:bifunctional tRNA (5-methylaminomethyl-2-thiouridine)(34)-methyltransferase MnmD/FAD-dependent 5-carboxymethylaminomethyl-2-thiouridine(34) oxidoreductase MnmC [Pedobacter sp.]
MTETLRPARLDWSQGQPASSEFGDIYFSRDGGDAETRHVFLAGNQLLQRFAALAPEASFTLIETGFGTGLNWLCTQALRSEYDHRGWLHYVSIEKHPLELADLKQAQDCWPAFAEFSQALQVQYPALVPGFHRLVFPQWQSTLTLVFADVQDALPRLSAKADAWFLDGFAPSRNPAMWTPELYAQMARLSRTGSSFATFTAAGDVRRGLAAAGFSVRKAAGFGKKREMLCGEFAGAASEKSGSKPWLVRPQTAHEKRHAIVIGAGISGASTAHALAKRGWQVNVLEAGTIAGAASGNPAAVVSLATAPQDEALDHFPHQASLYALRQLATEATSKKLWHACGVLELPAENRRKDFAGNSSKELPENLSQIVDAQQASDLCGIDAKNTAIKDKAIWQSQSGWLDAAGWCRELLAHPGINVQQNCKVHGVRHVQGGWQAVDENGEMIAEAPVLVIANSQAAKYFPQTAHLPLRSVRGQISLLPASSTSQTLKTVVCARGYITPILANGGLTNGQHCLGASFVPDDESLDIRESEHEENFAQLRDMLPALAGTLSPNTWQGRSSLRCQSPDYLPLLGPVASTEKMAADYIGLKDGKRLDYPPLATLPGLYVHLAQGSHGFSQAGLAAEILASEICAEPAPVSQKTLDSLHPSRFFIRELRRGKI